MSYSSNNLKNSIHGFFVSVATTVAEQNTILPLIVHHFTQNLIVIGIFATLLRGGAIVTQLFAAFYAQSYQRVMPYLRIVFFFRFLSWFSIGLFILFIGDKNKILTLWLIGISLFFFSFWAGFGGIYFKEIIAKCFDKEQRGRTMANKQLFASLGSLLSGGVVGYVLQNFKAPNSYAYLFIISATLLFIGFYAFSKIDEPIKKNISKKEESFKLFITNSYNILKKDHKLKIQIVIILLAYSYLLSMPFIIIKAKQTIQTDGLFIGSLITISMIGSIMGNIFLWKRFTHNYILMLKVSIYIMITLFAVAIIANSKYIYILIFFLFGISRDGLRNAQMNIILDISPEDKRPIYVAIESTFTSIGLFFPIVGGVVLKFFSFNSLYMITIVFLLMALIFTKRY